MATFGSFSLLIALMLAFYNLFAGAVSLRLFATGQATRISPQRLASSARRAGIAGFLAISCAAFALVWSAFTNDFSIAYILQHSNRALPGAYKFAALWSGQEGSLLLWGWLLAAFSFVLRLRHKTDVRLYAYAGTIMAGIQLFFLLVLNFAARPFALIEGYLTYIFEPHLILGTIISIPHAVTNLAVVPDDGNGLNPLLQYPEMVIHPPMLYLGYVGFAIPFAFALAALMMRYPGEKWIKITRTWTLVTWLFLTCGVFLGMHWAYAVLGWGGYWGWDPVENASFMPWLTGTAFLHSVMMQEKKGMMKSWNIWLIFSTFMLTLLGTLLTRAGLVSSVHAFAQSSIGAWFTGFMIVVAAFFLFVYILNRSHLKPEHTVDSLVSRESSFLFNNLILLTACFVVLWGTLFPILSEFVSGSKVTVGAPFYNRVAIPIGIFLLFLVGICPLLPWRSTSLKAIRRNFVLPMVAMWLAIGVGLLCGVRISEDGKFSEGGFYALLAFGFAACAVTAVLSEFVRGAMVIARQTKKNLAEACVLLVRRNTRRYGGFIVHIGVVVVFIGLAGSAFTKTNEQELALHGTMTIGPYRLECAGFTQDANDNYQSEYAKLNVWQNGQMQFQMYPEKRVYLVSQQPQTMVAIHSTLGWDLYVVYEGTNPDTGQPIIKAIMNPLVSWIWAGLGVMVLGTLIALTPSAKPNAGRTAGLAAGTEKITEGANQ
jgi:cytochrome c-type biogenesis protein CcmF